MRAIILAAGRGRRMNSYTEKKPKCLIELKGKTLLQWQLDALRSCGISKIAVVKGYRSTMINASGLTYFENKNWAVTNMVSSLTCAREWLRDDTCIVSYADIVYPSDTIDRLIRGSGEIVITYDVDWLKLWQLRFTDPLQGAETFRIDNKGRLLGIGKRATSIAEVRGQYMGLLKISKKGWRIIESYLSGVSARKRSYMDMTSLLSNLVDAGIRINTVCVFGRWHEIDTERDLMLCKKLFVRGWHRKYSCQSLNTIL